jgi:hypothetical protein
MKFYYLSNPYSGTEELKNLRARSAARACGKLIKDRVFTLSPIVHNHAMMKEYNEFTLEQRKDVILDFDFALLKASIGMIVLTIEGWKDSHGVKKEIEFCNENELPIYYFTSEEIESGHASNKLKI